MILLADYDIEKAFLAIENELMASMIRNMKRHRIEEIEEGKEWAMWQAMQLESLEKYKRDNRKKFQSQFSDINSSIESIIGAARIQGSMDQEIKILDAIRKGFKPSRSLKRSTQIMGEFFKLNDRKLEALIRATQNDFKKAEQAMLRMADDQYRKVIFNAQVYANTGAGTYEKAVDMATRDFIGYGINCIEYANGARHTIADYADMAIRTASKRAYLTGEGEKRQEWGISLVILKKRGNACPKCLPFVGKVLIDDVWSGGKQSDGPYMLMSTAMERGLYHPRCKDIHTTYFEGISTPGASYTRKELEEVEAAYRKDQKQQYAKRQEEKFGRLARHSLDEGNQKLYQRKEKEWKNVRFRTGDKDQLEYLGEKRERDFFGIPNDITSTWKDSASKAGSVSDALEYAINGQKFKVDGKKVLLDPSQHEKEVAECIAKLYGKNVRMIPRVAYPQGISTPDFEIDNKKWDLKTIGTAGKNVLYNAVKKKKRQASCFIFDVSDCPLEASEIKRQVNDLFKSTHLAFIDTVGVYKDSQIIGIYERKK
mgnify:CR=1 FL=1